MAHLLALVHNPFVLRTPNGHAPPPHFACAGALAAGAAPHPTGRGEDAAHYVPAPDDTVGELARRSAADGAGCSAALAPAHATAPQAEPELVLSYSTSAAFA